LKELGIDVRQFDVSDIVAGHIFYRKKMKQILKKAEFGR